ncbi:PepSY domain-containing protein [Tardiphaga sp.]|uniref:PepSY domain-containing protein n=1 Tax=Tardiphaga sp. TaxID=1926292 RepID=UPI0037DA4658
MNRAAFALAAVIITSAGVARATADIPDVTMQAQPGNGRVSATRSVGHELAAFRDARLGLRDALSIARRAINDGEIVDVSFDGTEETGLFRLLVVRDGNIEESKIDAASGSLTTGRRIPVDDLGDDDRANVASLQRSPGRMSDAVAIAEEMTGGRAVSGGLSMDARQLRFVVVVLSGDDLRTVSLEPPQSPRAGTK